MNVAAFVVLTVVGGVVASVTGYCCGSYLSSEYAV